MQEGALRVLVVDDDALIRKVLCFALKNAPIAIETVVAADGAEALRLCDSEQIHMALLDVELPDTSGFELCVRIRHHEKLMSVPIFMLTGRGDVDAKSEAFRAGADDYLVKPIVPEELVARAVRALERNYGVRPTVRRAELPLPVESAPAPVVDLEPQPGTDIEPPYVAAAFETSFASTAVDGVDQLDDPGDEQAPSAALAVESVLPEATLPPAPEPAPVVTTSVLPPAVPPILGPSTSEPRPPAFLTGRPPAPPPEDRADATPSTTGTARQNAWSKFLGRSRPQ